MQKEAASDQYSWPVLILAAIALAVVAETFLIAKVPPKCLWNHVDTMKALEQLDCATSCAVALIIVPEPTHHAPATGWPGYSCSAQLHNARMLQSAVPSCARTFPCAHMLNQNACPPLLTRTS